MTLVLEQSRVFPAGEGWGVAPSQKFAHSIT